MGALPFSTLSASSPRSEPTQAGAVGSSGRFQRAARDPDPYGVVNAAPIVTIARIADVATL